MNGHSKDELIIEELLDEDAGSCIRVWFALDGVCFSADF